VVEIGLLLDCMNRRRMGRQPKTFEERPIAIHILKISARRIYSNDNDLLNNVTGYCMSHSRVSGEAVTLNIRCTVDSVETVDDKAVRYQQRIAKNFLVPMSA